VCDNVRDNDTVAAGTQVLLPAAAWGEKDGTVTNSERRISRQRAFLPLPGEARPDWWIVGEVAKRMGFPDAFSFTCAADVFREHAALSGFQNNGTRDFDLAALATLTDAQYDALKPVQWGAHRFFAAGGFFTPDRKGRFLAPAAPSPTAALGTELRFRLNTRPIPDQWHTMTRSRTSPRPPRPCPPPLLPLPPAPSP